MVKALIEKELRKQINWQPHPKQQDVLNSDSEEVVIAAGRGFGKTYICSYRILKALLKGEQVLLVAPTYELCDRVLEYVDLWLREAFPPLAPAVSMRPPQSIDFRKLKDPGIPLGRLEARSAESPEGMLGKRFDLVVVDEAARIPREVWETYIFPTTQVTGGRQIYISTPRGKDVFYELWLHAKETGGAFRFESKESPYFTERDWLRARDRLPEDVFNQEYRANFLDEASQVFKKVGQAVSEGILKDSIPGHSYVLGLDLGRRHDFTVITCLDTYDNTVCHFDRFNKLDWSFQKKKIEACALRYNNALVVIDSNNVGDAMIEELERDGIFLEPFQLPGGRSRKKKELIEKLAVYLENRNITIPDIPILVDELKSFGWEFTPSKRVIYKPRSGHDDCVMSLAYAVSALHGKAHPVSPIKKELQRVYQSKKRLNQTYI